MWSPCHLAKMTPPTSGLPPGFGRVSGQLAQGLEECYELFTAKGKPRSLGRLEREVVEYSMEYFGVMLSVTPHPFETATS